MNKFESHNQDRNLRGVELPGMEGVRVRKPKSFLSSSERDTFAKTREIGKFVTGEFQEAMNPRQQPCRLLSEGCRRTQPAFLMEEIDDTTDAPESLVPYGSRVIGPRSRPLSRGDGSEY